MTLAGSPLEYLLAFAIVLVAGLVTGAVMTTRRRSRAT